MPRSATLPVWVVPVLAGCVPLADTVTTPQRPTVSSDTSTTKAGTVELEAGGDVDPGDGFTVPMTLKAGYDDSRELYVTWNAYEKYDEAPQLADQTNPPDAEGVGDVYVGLRERFWSAPDVDSTAAFLAELKLPTAEDDIGTGEVDFRAALIANRAWDRVALNGFYRLGLLGDPDDDGIDLEHTFTLTASGAITGPLGAFAEVAAIVSEDQDTDEVFTTAGFAWALAPSVVLDVGAVVGLSKDAPALRFIGGLTWNFGKFF